MANEDLGTLRYGIEVDTKGVDKGQEAMDGLSNTAEQTGKKIDGAEKSIDKVGKTSERSAKDVDKLDKSTVDVGVSMRDAIGYATAFAASLGAVAAISAESAKEIQNMARLSGTSVEEFQKLAFGANEAGISAEKLGDIYKDTQDKVGDFLNTGGGELKDYFETVAPLVGQTAEQFRGLSGPEALGLFQKGLEKANLSAAEQIFYLESLANDASLLAPLLADNGRGFAEAGKRADELNVVLSQFQIDELVEVNKAFNELSTTISRGTQSIVADNAEDIIDAIQSVSETIATATEFLNENMDAIKAAATVLGSAAVAYGTYRAAVLAATAAQAAFNIAARANPIGLLVTLAGAAAGAFATMSDETQTAADKVDELTGKTNALNFAEKELLKTKIEQRILDRQKELEIMQNQLVILQAQRDAETDIQKAGRGTGGEDALEAMTRKAEEAKDEITLLNEKLEELKVININSGSGQDGGGSVFAKMSDDLQDLIDKYNPLLAEQRELLDEQEKLRKSLQGAAKKDIPEITNALDAVGKKLDEVRAKINLKPDSSKPMSIFDVGADTSDDFSDVLVNNLSPKLNRELGVQAKTFGSRLSDEFGKLDWGSYGQNIGDALGQALVSGDSSGLRSALGGMLSNAVSSSVGPALTGSLTSALGAGAAGFLGPIGGGIAGAVAGGLLSGKEEVSRSIRIVFEDGIAQAFTNIQYDSMFGGSNKLVGFSSIENEMLNNTLRNATRGIDDLLQDLGRSVDDFSGTFEGADLGEAIEDFTGSYIDAGFGSIEAFQELGESAEQALERVTGSINDLNDAIRGVVGSGTELAVREFTQNLGDQIDANTELSKEYWEAAIVAIGDISEGATAPLDAATGDLVRSSAEYQRAFANYLATSSGGRFQVPGRLASGGELIDFIEQNQLPEAISRLGDGLVVATASFADQLASLVEGGDIKGALESLTNIIATDTENYANTIDNLRDDLVGLGFAGDLTAQEFAKIYNDALDGVMTPETLAKYANAAMLLEDIGDAAQELAGEQLADIRDGIEDLIEADEKRLKELRKSINQQIKDERERSDDAIEQMQKEQDALRSSISNAKSLINLIDSAMNTLAERSESLQKTIFARSIVDVTSAIATARSTGELPDSQLIEGSIRSISRAGSGNFATSLEREREALKARILLSELGEVSDDQLDVDEKQLLRLDELIEQEEQNSDLLISALEDQLEAAEEDHDELIETLNDQFDALEEYYSELETINSDQLEVLERIEDAFDSLPSALSAAIASIAGMGQGGGTPSGSSAPTNQDITDYLSQYTSDNFVSDEEALAIYNQAAASGVSTDVVGGILSDMTGVAINVNDWLERNNLPALQSASTATIEAINNMNATVTSALNTISSSSQFTADTLRDVTQGSELRTTAK